MATKRKAVSTFDGADVPAMRPEMRPVAQVHDYPNNARTHPPAQLALLSSLVKKFGFYSPIIVDDDGVILAGHGRKAAAILAGMDEVPVVVQRGMSEQDKIAMRLADNQVGLLSGYDNEVLRGEIVQLKAMDYDLQLLGFGDTQLVSFTTLPGPPNGFPAVGENIPTSFCCPRCRYEWSGAPKPLPEKEKKPRAAKKKQ